MDIQAELLVEKRTQMLSVCTIIMPKNEYISLSIT